LFAFCRGISVFLIERLVCVYISIRNDQLFIKSFLRSSNRFPGLWF
jgi:hypothetical protein